MEGGGIFHFRAGFGVCGVVFWVLGSVVPRQIGVGSITPFHIWYSQDVEAFLEAYCGNSWFLRGDCFSWFGSHVSGHFVGSEYWPFDMDMVGILRAYFPRRHEFSRCSLLGIRFLSFLSPLPPLLVSFPWGFDWRSCSQVGFRAWNFTNKHNKEKEHIKKKVN